MKRKIGQRYLPSGADPTYLQSLYNTIKSKEQGVPVPRTKNIFRKSEEWGQYPTPVAITQTQLHARRTGHTRDMIKVYSRSALRDKDYLLCIENTYYVVRGDKRSMAFSDKNILLAVYKTGRLRIIFPLNGLPSG